MSKAELVKGIAFELDPAKKYLIIFDRNRVTQQDVSNLMNGLGKEGFKGLGYMYDGDPSSIKIIEQK